MKSLTRREAHALAMWIVADKLFDAFQWEDYPHLTESSVWLVMEEIETHIELCRTAAGVVGAGLARKAMA